MNSLTIPRWVWICVCLTAALTLFSISYRYRTEQSNKAVGLCFDVQTLKDVGAAAGKTLPEMLEIGKKHGLVGVTLSEEKLSDYFATGQASLLNGMLRAEPGKVFRRVAWGIADRFGLKPTASEDDQKLGIFGDTGLSYETLSGVSVGLNPIDAKAVVDAKLVLIARLGNAPGITKQYVGQKLLDAKEAGATIFLPEGDQVLGHRGLIEYAAWRMKEDGIYYAAPEFAKLSGDTQMAKQMTEHLIRLHSIQSGEIDRMPPEDVVDRFVRAYRERNIRLLLLRPMTQASEDPMSSVTDLLDKVKSGVEKQGGRVTDPRPFEQNEEQVVPKPLFTVIAALIAAIAYWVFSALIKSSGWQLCAGIVLAGATVTTIMPIGKQAMALVGAMTFPVLAYLYLETKEKVNPIREYVVMSAISLVGGLCVAGILNDLSYYVRIQQFLGVKLAHFAPIAVIALLLIARRTDLKKSLRSPVDWLGLVLGLAALILLGLMFARTGNDNPAAVSDWELKFRALLDAFLPTRPRTKEFLFGNPALLLGLFALAASVVKKTAADGAVSEEKRPISPWAIVLLTVGAIGQTSIVNTMCHLHTPVDLSLLRIGLGLILGGILGALLWLFLRRSIVPAQDPI